MTVELLTCYYILDDLVEGAPERFALCSLIKVWTEEKRVDTKSANLQINN